MAMERIDLMDMSYRTSTAIAAAINNQGVFPFKIMMRMTENCHDDAYAVDGNGNHLFNIEFKQRQDMTCRNVYENYSNYYRRFNGKIHIPVSSVSADKNIYIIYDKTMDYYYWFQYEDIIQQMEPQEIMNSDGEKSYYQSFPVPFAKCHFSRIGYAVGIEQSKNVKVLAEYPSGKYIYNQEEIIRVYHPEYDRKLDAEVIHIQILHPGIGRSDNLFHDVKFVYPFNHPGRWERHIFPYHCNIENLYRLSETQKYYKDQCRKVFEEYLNGPLYQQILAAINCYQMPVYQERMVALAL